MNFSKNRFTEVDVPVWITWEDHRRSRELSAAFEAEYVCFSLKGPRFLRYVVLGAKTVVFVMRKRRRLVFCQNPSIALATILCLFKPILGYRLVVDRHSNFKFHTRASKSIKWKSFHFLSKWTVKKADATIVTNPGLCSVVEEWGGNGVVLQDKLPKLVPSTPPRRPGFMEEKNGPSVMCVTTYSDDEPIDELIEALRSIEGVTSYLTGNYSKTRYANELASFKEDGVVLTGYISEIDYVDLMASVDVVVVLTIHEDLLTCGAYEAISLEKPLVLSDTHALRSYFRGAATYVKPTASSIGEGITELLEKKKIESDGSIDWKREINDTWLIFFHKACFRLEETRCK